MRRVHWAHTSQLVLYKIDKKLVEKVKRKKETSGIDSNIRR